MSHPFTPRDVCAYVLGRMDANSSTLQDALDALAHYGLTVETTREGAEYHCEVSHIPQTPEQLEGAEAFVYAATEATPRRALYAALVWVFASDEYRCGGTVRPAAQNLEFCRTCGAHNPPRDGEGIGPCCPSWAKTCRATLRNAFERMLDRARMVSEFERGPVTVILRKYPGERAVVSIVGASVSWGSIAVWQEQSGLRYRRLAVFVGGTRLP